MFENIDIKKTMFRKPLHLMPNIENRLRDDKGRFASSPKTILIDESGELGNKHEKSRRYFIIAAIVTEKSDEIEEIIKKYPKNTRVVRNAVENELKFNTSNPIVRLVVLKDIELKKPKIFAVITDKKIEIIDEWTREGSKLYTKSVELLLNEVVKNTNGTMSIIFDENTALNQCDIVRICEKVAKINNKEIIFYSSVNSSIDGRIYAADFVASAIGYYYNSKKETKDRTHYLKVIKHCTKIIIK